MKDIRWLVCEELIGINRAPKGPLDTGIGTHVVTAMRRRPGLSPEEFRRHWQDHVEYVTATQGMSRYIANPVIDEWLTGYEPPADGLVEAWFPSMAHQRACFSDPLMTGPSR
jgi:hypothetical protein